MLCLRRVPGTLVSSALFALGWLLLGPQTPLSASVSNASAKPAAAQAGAIHPDHDPAALRRRLAGHPQLWPSLWGDGQTLTPVTSGATLARLRAELPSGPHFVLRGTVPLPKGSFLKQSSSLRLGVEVVPGRAVPAQVEVVSRYPRFQDGADVVEVIARVPRPAGSTPGELREFSIVHLAEGPPAPPVPSDARTALVQGPLDLPPAVTELLTQPGRLVLAARDVFDHRYELDLLDPASHYAVLKHGHHHAQVRGHASLRPVVQQDGPGGTLPHLFGAHAYLGTWSGEPVVTLDLRIHNGHDGADKSTNQDDPLGRVYFKQLELRVPAGYAVLQAFEHPGVGTSGLEGNQLVWALVERNPDGSMHVMPPHGQFHRRLAIAPLPALPRARALLEQQGLGFATRGVNAGGQPLYSWWNPSTARWFPQSFQLPHLEHVDGAQLAAQLEAEFDTLHGPFSQGISSGGLPLTVPRLGWAHPHGVSYGGMTGGDEIVLVDGVAVVEAASRTGYRTYQLRHRANTDRQPRAFFRYDGRPTRLEDWVQTVGDKTFLFSFYMGLQGGGQDPMGWSQAPTFQVEAVVQKGLEPAYQDELLSFQPHGLQHLIRYTRNAKVLVWAGNDSLAKDDLWMQTELFRLSYHSFLNGQWGYKDPTGLLYAQEFVAQNPGKGFPFGRGEAWGLDTAAAHFALADEDWRAMTLGWFADVMTMVRSAQIPCNGHIHAALQGKWLEGAYRVAQTAEDAIVQNMLLGLYETVFAGLSPSHAAMARDALVESLRAMIGGIQWSPTLKGPMNLYAVGPTDIALPVFCTASQQPADGKIDSINTYQTWSALGYGYRLTGDTLFLERAQEMAGKELYGAVTGPGTANLGNRAALLAVVQQLFGLL